MAKEFLGWDPISIIGDRDGSDAADAPDHEPEPKVVISHSRMDRAFAERLEAALKARAFEQLINSTKI